MGLKIAGATKMVDGPGLVNETTYLGLKVGATEVSGNGYTRKAIPAGSAGWNLTNQSSNTIRRAANKNVIIFSLTGNPGQVDTLALYDSATGGNELADQAVQSAPNAFTAAGGSYRVVANAFKINMPLT